MKSINHLLNVLDELKQNKDYEKIKIELTTVELKVLMNRIYKYMLLECHILEPYQLPHSQHLILVENAWTPLWYFFLLSRLAISC